MIVYKATNVENGWVYIGSTTSTLDQRKRDHLQKAENNCGHKFHDSIKTYGPETFVWETIDTAATKNELAEKERYYIINYSSFHFVYNQDCGGGFKKDVYQFDDDGKLINVYEDLQRAAKSVGVNKSSISAACLGKVNKCKGFRWSYSLAQSLILPTDSRFKCVEQYDLNSNIVNTYKSVADASVNSKVNKSCIAKCCRNERKTAGGFKWKYKQ